MNPKENNPAKNLNGRYKTVRIKNDDYQLLRKYAFEHETPMVEAISAALTLLTQEDKKDRM